MFMEPEEDQATLVEADDHLAQLVMEYRRITGLQEEHTAKAKELGGEASELKTQILELIGVDSDDTDRQESFALSVAGQPLLRVSVFPRSSVQSSWLRSYYPEIYQQSLKTTQQSKFTKTKV